MRKLFTFFAGIVILFWFIATAPFAQAISLLISLKETARTEAPATASHHLAPHRA